MIKQLITDIAHDNISLSQGLTRAKLIASRLKNDSFKEWLKKELEGYDYDDIALPDYRTIGSTLNLTIALPMGREQTIPVSTKGINNEKIVELMETHVVTEPIGVLEQTIKKSDSSVWQIQLTTGQVDACSSLFKEDIQQRHGALRSGYKSVGQTQFQNILELTKQKLLDTLIELDEQFPNLENEFSINKESLEKVQNIITNHVYGGSNPFNIAAGVNVTQTINNYSLSKEDEDKLKSFGVTQSEIESLKTTLASKKDDKEGFIKKSMKWLSSVTASMVARGAYDHLPALQEFVHNIVDKF